MSEELKVIQKLYDHIKWISPIINRLPRDRKFTIGDRILNKLYDILELLIEAKYTTASKKMEILKRVNILLETVRFYQRLLRDENLWSKKRFTYAFENVNTIGQNLGAWMKSYNKQ